MDGDEVLAAVGGFVFGFFLGIFALGLIAPRPSDVRKEIQQEAVKAGAVVYVVGANGEPVFQWRKHD